MHTMSTAVEHAQKGTLETWIHDYLRGEGRNEPFSDGLRLATRQYWGPVLFPLALLTRCTGPEPDMQYQVPAHDFEPRVLNIQKAVEAGVDLPPMIVNYSSGKLQLNDGNHRWEALVRNNVKTFGVVIWTTGESDLAEFKERYRGEYEVLV
jgi:hypothetical protein